MGRCKSNSTWFGNGCDVVRNIAPAIIGAFKYLLLIHHLWCPLVGWSLHLMKVLDVTMPEEGHLLQGVGL
ncbi:hypothetical protein OUZ56_023085 [Daphnia magna]|uniref:Uncharacterized protein n=1 Tax=Daphnia magna TaxID=35525 RepID=A0ABR0AYD5_9CRUS|nr:hypothetical protein OUZ56_023085 [Daphnia magna]